MRPITNLDLGPLCQSDHLFKALAREHQSNYRARVLQLDDYNHYGNRLAKKDAEAGKNFYSDFPGLFDEVQQRFACCQTLKFESHGFEED